MQGIYLFPLFSEIMGRHYNEKIFSLIFTFTKVRLLPSFKSQDKAFHGEHQSSVPSSYSSETVIFNSFKHFSCNLHVRL